MKEKYSLYASPTLRLTVLGQALFQSAILEIAVDKISVRLSIFNDRTKLPLFFTFKGGHKRTH